MHRLSILLTLLVAGFLMPSSSEERRSLSSTDGNAALRYWMAFAEMDNPPADKGLSELLEQTAQGAAPWNDERLGPILDRNEAAIQIMQRGSRLPHCTWGLETELGPETPIAHIARGRALARLNLLSGLRASSRADVEKAVEAWLSGIRFSRHLSREASLLGALVATSSLSAHLRALGNVAAEKSLAPALLSRIELELRALPAYGFDWGQIWSAEAGSTNVLLSRLENDDGKRFIEELQKYLLEPGESGEKLAGKLGVALTDLADARKMMALARRASADYRQILAETAAAYTLPYLQAEPRLIELERRRKAASPLVQTLTPSLRKANAVRAEAEAQRGIILGLLALRKAEPWLNDNGRPGLDSKVPLDPFSGKPFQLVRMPHGIEIQSRGKDAKGIPISYRLHFP